LIDAKTPLIGGAVPFKPASRKVIESEGREFSTQDLGVGPTLIVAQRHRLSATVGTNDHKRDIPIKLDRLRPSLQNQNMPSRRPHAW
jgi:hypothetical protein